MNQSLFAPVREPEVRLGTPIFPFAVSVFFPAYNDAPSLPSLLARTFEVLRRCVSDYEVIVVNDGSTDRTAEVLEELRIQYAPHLRVITHEQNRGYGGALRSGFAAATKEWVFYTDGDGQYDPGELEKLLLAVTPDTGLVNGYKIERHDPWHRVAIGWLYNRFARFLFGVHLRDIDCDFRLMRRSLLDRCALESTSGTICVELVSKLESQTATVAEVPVHHYPREHGRSQFFRLRSLATTFYQLTRLFLLLVVAPALRGQGAARVSPRLPERNFLLATLFAIAVLSVLPYARAVQLPPIADDYLQIQLARDFASPEGWQLLAGDALYRCRATSLFLTHWTEQLFGVDAGMFVWSSILIHFLNSVLVFALGYWRVIGWRISAIAAGFFALCHQHQEAVIWYAALPELLVFMFAVGSFLFWIRWLQSGRPAEWAGSMACFVLALFSKESAVAVVPLFALAAVFELRDLRKRMLAVLPAVLLAALYFLWTYAGRDAHQHFHDGTFDLSAPVLTTVRNSIGRLLWFWGGLSLVALLWWNARHRAVLITIALLWIPITLLPYSFLTYMPRVPSRHTYFATVGLALIIAAAWHELWRRTAATHRRWIPVALAGLIIVHHTSYLWIYKQAQFELRAEPTEALIRAASQSSSPVYVRCFPYAANIAELALKIRIGERSAPPVVIGAAALSHPDALNLCNKVAY